MPHDQLNFVVEPPPAAFEDRLDSWKAIAAHLGRSVRTVQRWKRTAGLPVHYVNNRIAAVYASRRELDTWLAGRSVRRAPEAREELRQAGVPLHLPSARRSTLSSAGVVGAVALTILLTVSALGPGRWGSAGRPEVSPAREQVLRGEAFLSRATPTDAQRAIEAFERAVERDPSDAAAYAGLAQAYSRAANFVLPAAEARRRSLEALNRALALDATLPGAYLARGLLLAGDRYDIAGARADFEKAGALRGGSAVARLYGGMMLIGLGQAEAGLREIERAHREDPLNMKINARLGMSYGVLGEPHRGISHCSQAIELEPFSPEAHYCLGYVLEHAGEHETAMGSYRKAEELGMRTRPAIARTLARAGDAQAAQQILGQIEAVHQQGEPWPAYQVAQIYAALGNTDRAFDELDRALRDRDSALVGLAIDPDLQSLRTDARFPAMVKRLGLYSAEEALSARPQSYRSLPGRGYPFEKPRR